MNRDKAIGGMIAVPFEPCTDCDRPELCRVVAPGTQPCHAIPCPICTRPYSRAGLVAHLAARLLCNRPSPTEEHRLTPEWCLRAFYRVNPGAHGDNVNYPSLYLLDFAREVLYAFPSGGR